MGQRLDSEIITSNELLFFNRKMNLLPVYEKLRSNLLRNHTEIDIIVSKTQVSFRNRYIFALVSFQPVPHVQKEYLLVSFGLGYEKQSPRIAVATEVSRNRWTHHVIVRNENEIDAELLKWIEEAYLFADSK